MCPPLAVHPLGQQQPCSQSYLHEMVQLCNDNGARDEEETHAQDVISIDYDDG